MNKGRLLPPIYFLFYLLLVIVLHYFFPVKLVITDNYKYIGSVFIVFGIFLAFWASVYFKMFDTSIKPFDKSTRLIIRGPYKYSRNPIYLGGILTLIGAVIYLGSLISFLAPLLFYITMNKLFIVNEEKDLEQAFGEEYLNYKKRVRRWV